MKNYQIIICSKSYSVIMPNVVQRKYRGYKTGHAEARLQYPRELELKLNSQCLQNVGLLI